MHCQVIMGKCRGVGEQRKGETPIIPFNKGFYRAKFIGASLGPTKYECQCTTSMCVFTESFDCLPQSDGVIFGVKAWLWLDGSPFSILKSSTTFPQKCHAGRLESVKNSLGRTYLSGERGRGIHKTVQVILQKWSVVALTVLRIIL